MDQVQGSVRFGRASRTRAGSTAGTGLRTCPPPNTRMKLIATFHSPPRVRSRKLRASINRSQSIFCQSARSGLPAIPGVSPPTLLHFRIFVDSPHLPGAAKASAVGEVYTSSH
jgi:hypothetical protein